MSKKKLDKTLKKMLDTPPQKQETLKEREARLKELEEHLKTFSLWDDEYSDFKIYEALNDAVDDENKVSWEEYKEALDKGSNK